MPWVCKFGVCPDKERECEDCSRNCIQNDVHWVDKVKNDKKDEDEDGDGE